MYWLTVTPDTPGSLMLDFDLHVSNHVDFEEKTEPVLTV